jgi:hypothetical protein
VPGVSPTKVLSHNVTTGQRVVKVPPKKEIIFHRVSKPSLFCDSALRSDCMAGCGLLTVRRVRNITISYQGKTGEAAPPLHSNPYTL